MMHILAVASLWHGSDANAYVRAFRRLGHSVQVIPQEEYIPIRWRRRMLRGFRRFLEPWMIQEFSEEILKQARHSVPDLFFVFKGRCVTPEVIRSVRDLGVVAVNVYPDVSFRTHGPWLPKALPVYDWVFTTKTFGITDMKEQLGITSSSLLLHGYDPDVHHPWTLSESDRKRFECDVSFIGTWSPKKQKYLEALRTAAPELHLRIWGEFWDRPGGSQLLKGCVSGYGVIGDEYAKAVTASRINVGILSEARLGSSSGDQITSRTFHIPAIGGFLAHERTEEFSACFTEGVHCAAFDSPDELVDVVRSTLKDEPRRLGIAAAGHQHCLASGYSQTNRAEDLLATVAKMIAQKRS